MGHPEVEGIGLTNSNEMRIAHASLFCFALSVAAGSSAAEPRQLWLVLGAPGEESFAADFAAQTASWRAAAEVAGDLQVREIRDRAALQAACLSPAASQTPELWIVLIGHGTFDGRIAKFNLEGPDVAASELAEWLRPRVGSLAVIHTGECSSPFLPPLAGPDRVIITATQSGSEVVTTRFGGRLAQAWLDPAADLDRDGAISLLEAFLIASGRTTEFYEQRGRLVSEHALLEDNGDGKGTRADWFEGLRVVRKSADGAAPDGGRARGMTLAPSASDRGLSAEQRARRARMEAEIETLRGRRAEMGDAAWYDAVEAVLLELGKLRSR